MGSLLAEDLAAGVGEELGEPSCGWWEPPGGWPDRAQQAVCWGAPEVHVGDAFAGYRAAREHGDSESGADESAERGHVLALEGEIRLESGGQTQLVEHLPQPVS